MDGESSLMKNQSTYNSIHIEIHHVAEFIATIVQIEYPARDENTKDFYDEINDLPVLFHGYKTNLIKNGKIAVRRRRGTYYNIQCETTLSRASPLLRRRESGGEKEMERNVQAVNIGSPCPLPLLLC